MSKQINLQRQLDKTLRQAVALQQNAAFVEAEALYREILQLRPNHFDALQLLGTLALQSGRWDEGIELLRKAVAINAMQAPIHSNLAFAYNAAGRFKEGLASADRAVSLRREFADAWNNRGNALAGLDKPQDALHSYERAIALKPDFAQALNNRACVLRDLGRAVDALESCDRAITLWPDYADAWSNRGNALGDLGRPEEARTSYQRAIAIAPTLVDAWNNQGLCLIELNRREEALLSYQQALSLAPDYAETHWNESLCLLQVGRLEEGWRKYEWRWQRNRIKASRRTFEQPLWLGDEAIAGKTILLHAEQGLGDTLQFCRYASLVSKLGARVVLEVPAELLTLLANLDGVAQIIEQGAALPPFDYHCPLLSLPLAFSTSVSTIPSATPYLFADADRAQQWRARIGNDVEKRLKVGLVWAGGNRAGVAELRNVDARRSIALAQLKPLLDLPFVQYYSLQKGTPAQQLARLQAEQAGAQDVVDYAHELTDFADTAALVENLDLIISVDTSTAHLAGAMGKPVWILNRFDTCWRWMLERDDSPWYPSARLFRQPALGDWENVIESVTTALQSRAEARS